MGRAPSHKKAIASIAAKLNLPEKDVSAIMRVIFSGHAKQKFRAPNAIRIPYIGTLVPDMRAHRHLMKREGKLKHIGFSRFHKGITTKKKLKSANESL